MSKRTQSVQKNVHSLCDINRYCKQFSQELFKKIAANASTLLSVLHACVDVNRRERKRNSVRSSRKTKLWISSNTAVIGVCAGVILGNANHHMNLVTDFIDSWQCMVILSNRLVLHFIRYLFLMLCTKNFNVCRSIPGCRRCCWVCLIIVLLLISANSMMHGDWVEIKYRTGDETVQSIISY